MKRAATLSTSDMANIVGLATPRAQVRACVLGGGCTAAPRPGRVYKRDILHDHAGEGDGPHTCNMPGMGV